MMVIVEHEHHSSRFDRSMQSLEVYIEAATKRCNMVSVTEVGNNVRDNALRHHPGWGVSQIEGPNGQSECALMYKKDVFEFVRHRTIPVAHVPGIRGEDTVQLISTTLDSADGRIKVGVFHGPSGIEGRFGFTRSLDTKAHHEMMYELRQLMTGWQHNPFVDGWLLTGDGNLDLRKLWVRLYLRKMTPEGARINWTGNLPKKGGTHGSSRIIDLSWYGKMKLIRTGLAPDDESSDHRPFKDAYIL